MKISWLISLIMIAATNIYSNNSFAVNSENDLESAQQTQIGATKNDLSSDDVLQNNAEEDVNLCTQ